MLVRDLERRSLMTCPINPTIQVERTPMPFL